MSPISRRDVTDTREPHEDLQKLRARSECFNRMVHGLHDAWCMM